jgi:hypothetical protein
VRDLLQRAGVAQRQGAANCTPLADGSTRLRCYPPTHPPTQHTQDLTLAEKMQRWQNVKLTGRIMATPMATFAAGGLAFGAVECAMRNYMGRDDSLTGARCGLGSVAWCVGAAGVCS